MNRFVVACIVFAVIHVGALNNDHIQPSVRLMLEQLNVAAMERANNLGWWSLVSLLSSSCCALQLLLNLFSYGCAGFNTVLGPARPVFLATTLYLQYQMWSNIRLSVQLPRAYTASLVTALLTFLPELVQLFNYFQGRRVSSGGSAAQIRIDIDGMGCVACVRKIQSR